MNEPVRPDPDALLAQLQARTTDCGIPDSGRGQLKIFLGYAAGVGKTYAMLKAAREECTQGKDLVAGYVEPHARPETAELLEGLEVLPSKEIGYKGIALKEFDVDAALLRRPALMLVDEMAHTNAEGCRNRKRYQDIEELLQAGISVWTTLNIQHLESLNDVIASLTGVIVRERIPDRLFDTADQVQLVDIEPGELVRRLQGGKIYREEQAERAMRHFFLPENLITLREIALRRMADRVNLIASTEHAVAGEDRRQVKEHILLCLSGAPSNARVIRTAARMAEAFHGFFTALFVQNDTSPNGDEKNKAALRKNTKLAEELGAHLAVVQGEDVPAAIAAYARRNGVHKIVLGRSPAPRGLWGRGKTLVERLAELAPDIDTYIIPDVQPPGGVKRRGILADLAAQIRQRSGSSWTMWGRTLFLLTGCTLAGCLMHEMGMRDANIISLFMVGVLGVAAWTEGPWYGGTASLASVCLFDFFCTPPYYSLHVYDPSYLATFSLMLLTTLIGSTLTARIRDQARQSAARAVYSELLLGNSRRLLKMEDEEALLEETGRQLSGLLGRAVVLYPAREGQLGAARFFSLQKQTMRDEQGVAQWVLKNKKEAGSGTDTLPGAHSLYIPVGSSQVVFAVVGIACFDAEGPVSLDASELNMARALISECAMAVEKERLVRVNAAINAQVQQEKLRADVLRTVSHDLRTPLTSICGNAMVLHSDGESFGSLKRQELAGAIEDDALRLMTMVENLLSMTRLEQQGFSLRLEAELVEDVLAEAQEAVRRRASPGHVLSLDVPDCLLMARMDARLIVQVLVNLLDNAINYTPVGTRIRLRAWAEPDVVWLAVSDNGPGIPEAEQKQLFTMFSSSGKTRSDGRRGMGLGLALCRSIIRAHGGELLMRDADPEGAEFLFSLKRERCPGEPEGTVDTEEP